MALSIMLLYITCTWRVHHTLPLLAAYRPLYAPSTTTAPSAASPSTLRATILSAAPVYSSGGAPDVFVAGEPPPVPLPEPYTLTEPAAVGTATICVVLLSTTCSTVDPPAPVVSTSVSPRYVVVDPGASVCPLGSTSPPPDVLAAPKLTTVADAPEPSVALRTAAGVPLAAPSVAVVPSTTTTGAPGTVLPPITVEGAPGAREMVCPESVVIVPEESVPPLGKTTAGGEPDEVGAGVRAIGRVGCGFGLGLLLAVVPDCCGLEPPVAVVGPDPGCCVLAGGFVPPVEVDAGGGLFEVGWGPDVDVGIGVDVGFDDDVDVDGGLETGSGSVVLVGGELLLLDAGGCGPPPSTLIVVVSWLVSVMTGTWTDGSPEPLGTEQDRMFGMSFVIVGVAEIQKSIRSVPGAFAYSLEERTTGGVST